MSLLKTIEDALIAKGLDAELARKAAFNTIYLNEPEDDITNALQRDEYGDVLWGLFTWDESEEGHNYWCNIAEGVTK